jgi:hypothetical protein
MSACNATSRRSGRLRVHDARAHKIRTPPGLASPSICAGEAGIRRAGSVRHRTDERYRQRGYLSEAERINEWAVTDRSESYEPSLSATHYCFVFTDSIGLLGVLRT